MPREIFQLRVVLDGVTPPVWRRLLVPGGFTLDRLHRVIQYAMGWQDCHLHSFDIDGIQYGQPDLDDEVPLRDELDARLLDVLGPGDTFHYTYDYGDWWEHGIEVEAVLLAEPGERYPICLAGERACPPEDVGGPVGYAELVRALADESAPDHARLKAWLGRDLDPDAFDPDRATTLIRRFA